MSSPSRDSSPKHITHRRLHPVILIALVLWIAGEAVWVSHLGAGLPENYTTHRWDLAWVGLDVAQLAVLLGLLITGWYRHRSAIIFSAAAGVLLLTDTWFDLTTASTRDMGQSILTALAQVPFGVALLWVAVHNLGKLAPRPDQNSLH